MNTAVAFGRAGAATAACAVIAKLWAHKAPTPDVAFMGPGDLRPGMTGVGSRGRGDGAPRAAQATSVVAADADGDLAVDVHEEAAERGPADGDGRAVVRGAVDVTVLDLAPHRAVVEYDDPSLVGIL